MTLSIDRDVDALYVQVLDEPVLESEEVEPGVVFDFGKSGAIVGVEITGLSERLESDADRILSRFRKRQEAKDSRVGESLPTYNAIPFGSIKSTLLDLFEAAHNSIEREWPDRFSDGMNAAILLRGMIRNAENSYKTIVHLCQEKPRDPFQLEEFALSVPPISRSVLDELFHVVFLLDDLPNRSTWYHKSGWKELSERHQRYSERYAGDALWTDWFAASDRYREMGRMHWEVTNEEGSDPAKIKYYPIPHQMLGAEWKDERRRSFLTYMIDWFNREMSQATHLTLPGVVERASLLFHPSGDNRDSLLSNYRSDCVVSATVIVVSILSEIEIEFKYGLTDRLQQLWAILNSGFLESKEVYDLRYADLL